MDNNNQAAFMGALNSLKEYAKVNGNIVTKQDVESYFKDLGLDDSKYQMITGYLLANDITVKGCPAHRAGVSGGSPERAVSVHDKGILSGAVCFQGYDC